MKRSKRLGVLLGVLAAVTAVTFGVSRIEQYQEKIKNSDEVILEVDPDAVQTLSWDYDGKSFAFHREKSWIYDSDEAFPVDEDKISQLLGLFSEFGVSFVIEDVEDYSQYGLDDPLCTISFATEDETYEMTLGNYSAMDEERYVSIGDGNVYLVQTDPLDYFDAGLQDLIKNDTVPSFDSVSRISFAGEAAYTAQYQEDSTDSYCADDVYFAEKSGETVPLDTSRVESYLKNLTGLSLTDFMTYDMADAELAQYGLDDPQLTISVDYTEEDEDGQTTEGTFTLYVGRGPEELEKARQAEDDASDDTEETVNAYVRVGDSSIIYQITAEEYDDLLAASVDDLRHQELLSFDFDEITSMDVMLEGETYTITAEGRDDDRTWSFDGEEIEIAELKNALESLKADTFTEEAATQKEEISVTLHLEDENHPKLAITLYRYDGSDCLAVINGESQCLVKRSLAVDLVEAVHSIVLGAEQNE